MVHFNEVQSAFERSSTAEVGTLKVRRVDVSDDPGHTERNAPSTLSLAVNSELQESTSPMHTRGRE